VRQHLSGASLPPPPSGPPYNSTSPGTWGTDLPPRPPASPPSPATVSELDRLLQRQQLLAAMRQRCPGADNPATAPSATSPSSAATPRQPAHSPGQLRRLAAPGAAGRLCPLIAGFPQPDLEASYLAAKWRFLRAGDAALACLLLARTAWACGLLWGGGGGGRGCAIPSATWRAVAAAPLAALHLLLSLLLLAVAGGGGGALGAALSPSRDLLVLATGLAASAVWLAAAAPYPAAVLAMCAASAPSPPGWAGLVLTFAAQPALRACSHPGLALVLLLDVLEGALFAAACARAPWQPAASVGQQAAVCGVIVGAWVMGSALSGWREARARALWAAEQLRRRE